MPSSWLSVPHFQQEHEYSCLAACVRMVLAHYGDVRAEADLRALLATQPTGTRAGNLMRLSSPDFEVYLRSSNLLELQQALAAGQPPIVFLLTGALEYWGMDIFPTAVLVGVDATTVVLHDPYFATPAQTTSLPTFEKAWSEMDQFTAFIRPRTKKP